MDENDVCFYEQFAWYLATYSACFEFCFCCLGLNCTGAAIETNIQQPMEMTFNLF